MMKLIESRNYAGFLIFLAIAALVFYFFLFLKLFHSTPNLIGHDYTLIIPHLLEGLKFIKSQGWFPVPRYSISFCGAIPFFADPQNFFYSPVQLLVVLFEPVLALKISFLFYFALAFTGAMVFFRKVMSLSLEASIIGSLFFLCNGYLRSRLLIGHYTFISFALLPLALYFLASKKEGNLKASLILGLIFASFVYGGAHYMLFVYGVSLVLMISLLSLYSRENLLNTKVIFKRLLYSSFIGILLSLSKIVAAFSYMKNVRFKRAFLFDFSVLEKLKFFISQFWAAYLPKLEADFWEYECSLSILIPIIILLVFTKVDFCRSILSKMKSRKVSLVSFLILAIITMLFSLNMLIPRNLKEALPILKSMQISYRFSAAFIFPIILISITFYEQALKHRLKKVILVIALILVPMEALLNVKEYKYYMSYERDAIAEVYNNIKTKDLGLIKVKAFDSPRNSDLESMRNNLSNPTCYLPIFPKSPAKLNKLGDFEQVNEKGEYNLLNPACMIYREANNCSAKFEKIKEVDLENLRLLSKYQNPKWRTSALQSFADFLCVLAWGIFFILVALRRQFW